MNKQRIFPSGWKTKVNTPCPLLAPCVDCKDLLPVCNFYAIKSGRKTILGTKIAAACPSCSNERYKTLDPRLKLYYGARKRASDFGLEFSLLPDDIRIPETCPIRGTKITDGTGSGPQRSSLNFDSPSLDRVNNQRGYTPENVRVVSRKANLIKSNASCPEIIRIILYMLDNQQALDPEDFDLLDNLRIKLNTLNPRIESD